MGSFPWIGKDAIGLYMAKSSDPVRRWSYDARAGGGPTWRGGPPILNGWIRLATPTDIRFLGGTDKHAILIDPDHRYGYEVWLGEAWGDGYHATILVRTDLRGSGISLVDGQSQGIRAFGGSLAGGLIRCPRAGEWRYPPCPGRVVVQRSAAQGLDHVQAEGLARQFHDDGGRNGYAGQVPMGALLAIPADVDIEKLR